MAKEVPKICELIDEMNIYVGCESGAIVHVQLDPLNEAQNFSESIIKETGPLLSALRGLLPLGQKKQIPGVAGLAVLGPLIFALYEDAKLRVWSSTRGNSLVLSINIPTESWNPEAPAHTSKWGLRILNSSNPDNDENNGYEDENSTKTFKLGIYLGLTGDSQVQVYDGSFDPASGTTSLVMEGVSYYGNDRFIDFAISPGQSLSIDEDSRHPRVWGLWQGMQPEEGDYVLAHAQLARSKSSQVLEVNNWTEANLESPSTGLESLISPNPSTHPNLAESFLRHIFQPGRFSHSIILRALQVFVQTRIAINQPSSTRELKAIVATELRREILTRTQAQAQQQHSHNGSAAPSRSGSPHRSSSNSASSFSTKSSSAWRIAHSTWTQFLEMCIQVWKAEHTPVALFCVPNTCGLMIIIKTGQISALRETTMIESLSLLTPRSRATFQHALLSTFLPRNASTSNKRLGRRLPQQRSPASQSNSHASELFKTLDLMATITSQIGSAKLETFEQRLFNLTDPVASATIDVEYLFGSPLDNQSANGDFQDDFSSSEDRISRRSFINRFIRAARSVSHIGHSIEHLLHLVVHSIHSDTSSDGLYPQLDSGELSAFSPDSEILSDVIARGFQQSVSTNFDMLRDMLYLALLSIRAELQLNLDGSVLSSLHSLLPRIARQLKAHHVLKWVSMQWITGNPAEAALSAVTSRRDGPASPIDELILRRRMAFGPVSAVHLYLMDAWDNICRSTEDARAWRSVSTFVSSLVRLVHPDTILTDSCSFTNQLLVRGQHLTLFEYIRLLDSKTAYHRDLMGDCYLALGQYEKALECFVQASINLDKETSSTLTSSAALAYENPLVLSVRQTLGRDRAESESYGLYYWKALLPDLIAQQLHDMVIRSASCALSSTETSDEATFSLLYSYIFTSALAIDHHEEAYAALIHINDDAKRIEALTEFVLSFIERGKGRELAELPFVNMLDQVHSLILQRARSSDITVPGPTLYHILYGFHINKSNYRLAAEAIFIYAERIVAEQHLGLSSLERYSAALLATLSALKLLDPSHAYLVSRRLIVPQSPHKRQRELSAGLGSLQLSDPSSATRNVEIYDIPRLELLYLIAQCNLALVRLDKSLVPSGIKSAPATLLLLVSFDHFELAYKIADKAKLPMDSIFSRHTLYCLRQASGKTAWSSLRSNLTKYDSASTNLHYHFIVADTILSTDRSIALPVWLILSFKSGHPLPLESSASPETPITTTVPRDTEDKSVQLLMIYIKHGLVDEAAKLSNEIVLRATRRLESSKDTSSPLQSGLPYTYIEQTLHEIQTSTSPNALLHEKVATALKTYLDVAVDKTNQVLELQE